MNKIDVKQVVRNVLRDDGDPPSADYSPYDYGAEVAHKVNEESVPLLITESLQVLPGSLAESFLNGVLDHHSIASLKDSLFEALPRGREIGSATAIVSFLLNRCHMTRLDLVSRLATEIQRTTEAHAQDLYAFAIWLVFGDQKSPPQMNPKMEDDRLIQSTLAKVPTDPLTKYAREILSRCKL
jgi:hypothetical protein